MFKRFKKKLHESPPPTPLSLEQEDTTNKKIGAVPVGPVFYIPEIVYESYKRYYAARKKHVIVKKPVLDSVRITNEYDKARLKEATNYPMLMPGIVSDVFITRRFITLRNQETKEELANLPPLIKFELPRKVTWDKSDIVLKNAVPLWERNRN